MPDVYLPLCLPFAVIVTLPGGVSLEKDAPLPLYLPAFLTPPHTLTLSLSLRPSVCRLLFSNTKPPLGVESAGGAHAARGVAQ